MFKKFKEIQSNIPIQVKASIAFFLANIISKGVAYITTPLYTRLLTSQEFGEVSVFLTWLEVFGILAMFGLSNGVFNNGMVDYPNKRNEFSFSMLGLSNVITFVFAIIILIIYPYIKKYIGLDYSLIVLMCFIFLLKPAYSFWITKQRYEYKYVRSFITTVLIAVISPIIAITAILNTNNHVYARIFGAQIPMLVLYSVFYFYLGYVNKWKINKKYWRNAIAFNLPLIPHYLSAYLLNSSDKLMISKLINDSATAYYTVAYAVAAVVFIIWNSANSSLIPYTYEKCKANKYEDISTVAVPVLILFAAMCFLVILFAPEVFTILTTKEYSHAMYVIPPIVGGVFFQAQYDLYANIVYFYKMPKYVMVASLFSCALNLVLNYIFIPKFGFIAAGYTTLVSYMAQAYMDYWAMKRITKCKIYDMKVIVALSMIIVLISLTSRFLYQNIVLRYSIIAILLVGFVLNRKKILLIVRMNK